jgi:hypothetical protein
MIQIGINIAVKGSKISGTPPPPIAPVSSVPPVISGGTSVGSLLTSTLGSWLNFPISYAFQWKRNTIDIPSATTSTYTLVQADAAQDIFCVVTATNAGGSTPATSNNIYIFDLDAQNFITNAAISGITQQLSINNLVIGLKLDSLWTKMLAVYPFVGGTATTCKFNLKNPLDTNAAFRLFFSGGWTFSNNGIQPNGTNAYADTFLIPNTSWTLNNGSVSAYSRTNNTESGVLYGTKGLNYSSSVYPVLDTSLSYVFHNAFGVQLATPPTTTAINFMSSRINTNEIIVALNGTTTPYSSTPAFLSTSSIYLGARNNNNAVPPDLWSGRQLAFAHIGTGLTQAECTLLYNRIQTFQTTLGRANP